MNLKNKIIAGTVALVVGGVGYLGIIEIKTYNTYLTKEWEKHQVPIVGTVLKEGYENTLSPVDRWDGLVSYSNETIKLDSKYTLKIKTDDGRVLGVSVINSKGTRSEGAVTKESLDILVSVGSRISFPSGNWKSASWVGDERVVRYPSETNFTQDTQKGTKRADRITVLDKE